jgi:hypothetical protein
VAESDWLKKGREAISPLKMRLEAILLSKDYESPALTIELKARKARGFRRALQMA